MTEANSVAADYEEYKAAGRIWGQVPQDRIKKIKFPRASAEVREAFLAIEDMTTSVSDILDSLGICSVVAGSHLPGLLPGKRMVGTAVTLRSIPERKTPTQGYIDKEPIRMSTREVYYLAEEGDVLVADFGGNLDVSNMGGMSCTVGQSVGFVGAVVHGAVRDVNSIRKLDYPVWASGVTPITGKFRMEAIEINGPVTVHGIVVEPGDLVVADDSGVCFIPSQYIDRVLAEAQAIEGAEDTMRDLIVNKRPISELRPLFRKRYD
ncbi:RraA family protein [Sphingomonas naphthae]|uniref:Putative 4-hydroxy-4-methyl-2-oxoglutarate aldolase n=1 Tax=Sphingomonas naphthae TaxID=1813468 RepID=A0ABY7TKU7_9SPHN|nr:RraA family protein [Sphingomonas naphthae]WCT73789.1 RraA family protein [Sphingomonas naphthae]